MQKYSIAFIALHQQSFNAFTRKLIHGGIVTLPNVRAQVVGPISPKDRMESKI